MNKRGLSGVVTVILIILLVLVAVGIIWAAIRPPIEETVDGISGDCLTLDVEALNCEESGTNYTVGFIRNNGAGGLSDVAVVFYDPAGQTRVFYYGAALNELETGSLVVPVGNFTGFVVDRANVAAVIQPGEDRITCDITAEAQACD